MHVAAQFMRKARLSMVGVSLVFFAKRGCRNTEDSLLPPLRTGVLIYDGVGAGQSRAEQDRRIERHRECVVIGFICEPQSFSNSRVLLYTFSTCRIEQQHEQQQISMSSHFVSATVSGQIN